MKKIVISQLAAVLSLSSIMVSAPVALAEDRECRGTLGNVLVEGNVIVPDGASCSLDSTTVKGDVTVKSRASLTVNGANISGSIQGTVNGANISGSIQGEGANKIDINSGTRTGNNVLLRRGEEVAIDGATITGDLQLEANTGAVSVASNTIIGNLQAKSNRDSGITISANQIGNNLQCQDNNPAPTGGDNTAKQKEGQCENL